MKQGKQKQQEETAASKKQKRDTNKISTKQRDSIKEITGVGGK